MPHEQMPQQEQDRQQEPIQPDQRENLPEHPHADEPTENQTKHATEETTGRIQFADIVALFNEI